MKRHLRTENDDNDTVEPEYPETPLVTVSQQRPRHGKLGNCELRVLFLERGSLLHNRSFDTWSPLHKEGPVWFSREHGYGSPGSYGPHASTHKAKRDLKLIDVAKSTTRDCAFKLAVRYGLVEPCGDYGNPFNNAWGEGCSRQAAVTLCRLAEMVGADGWVAEQWDEEDQEGPFEIMLCCPEQCSSLLS
jgi:hypothetical protein